jgi:Tfp pilus assembly protein PilO
MTARRIDQIWLFGGLALIAIIIATGWFFLISPQYADEAKAQADTGETAAQLAKAKSSFSNLQEETKKLGTYEAELAKFQAALPATSRTQGIPDFLKQLQNIGTALNIEVSGYSASDEQDSDEVPTVKKLPITLTAKGPTTKISQFLAQLQEVQPRAVLIDTAGVTIDDKDVATLTLTLDAFVTSTVTDAAE